MNYEQARQRIDGRWEWTCKNDGQIWPTGYCQEFTLYKEICRRQLVWPKYYEIWELERVGLSANPNETELHDKFKDKYHSDGHATKEEAERCHYEYILDNEIREFTSTNERHCRYPDCEEWTEKGFQISSFNMIRLCDQHRNRTGIKTVYPFTPNMQIIHS